MIVSPRETQNVCHGWRSLVCASLLLAASLAAALLAVPAAAEEPRFFRIGTAATGGSFFEVGGLIASVISRPAAGPACDRGGSCGVSGLVAVAQATPGSVENLRLINSRQIESGFAQADLAAWAYDGEKLFAEWGAMHRLRAIASLFPEAAHLVVLRDSPIRSLADLKGKTVSVGEEGSGSAADAAVLLAAAGVGDNDLHREYRRPGPAAEELKAGKLDALFLVGGYPVPAIRELAATVPIRLVPIEGSSTAALKKDFPFYRETTIPAGSYRGVDRDTPSIGFSALWLVNADVDSELVYAITRSLWHPSTVPLLAALDPIGKQVRLDHALQGLSVPLHPGAERFYREKGMPVGNVPVAEAGPGGDKQP